jgi:acetoin:2,6-dichlorophenolindophenol oxidoreductase subunit alpha
VIELLDLYRDLYRIRRCEETILANFGRGVFFGTTHTCLGQEADAVAVLTATDPGDLVFSNHRGHGHFLAYAARQAEIDHDPALLDQAIHALFAELMGRATGISGGRGGSQHLHWRNFYSNGVQGGIVPVATGMALAEKWQQRGSVTVVFLGDGTMGEGAVYETLNLAALWQAPVLLVVENNHIAQTTPSYLTLAGSIAARFTAFDIPVCELDSSDVTEILPVAQDMLAAIRSENSPQALILHTCRFGPHSKGDDTRPAADVALLRDRRDPVTILRKRCLPDAVAATETQVDAAIIAAFDQALTDPYPYLP